MKIHIVLLSSLLALASSTSFGAIHCERDGYSVLFSNEHEALVLKNGTPEASLHCEQRPQLAGARDCYTLPEHEGIAYHILLETRGFDLPLMHFHFGRESMDASCVYENPELSNDDFNF